MEHEGEREAQIVDEIDQTTNCDGTREVESWTVDNEESEVASDAENGAVGQDGDEYQAASIPEGMAVPHAADAQDGSEDQDDIEHDGSEGEADIEHDGSEGQADIEHDGSEGQANIDHNGTSESQQSKEHMSGSPQTVAVSGRGYIKPMLLWFLIHIIVVFAAIMVVIHFHSFRYERLDVLIQKYCDERLRQDSSDTSLYTTICSSLQSNPPWNNQLFQEFKYNQSTTMFYFTSEVIILLKTNATARDVKVNVNPISGSLAEKKGWYSAGPLVDITVDSGNSNIELVGLPHILSKDAPINEMKVFYRNDESGLIEHCSVYKLLKYHLFYRPGRQFSSTGSGTNKTMQNTHSLVP